MASVKFSWDGGSLEVTGDERLLERIRPMVAAQGRLSMVERGPLDAALSDLEAAWPDAVAAIRAALVPASLTFRREEHALADLIADRMRAAGLQGLPEGPVGLDEVLRVVDGLPMITRETPVQVLARLLEAPPDTPIEQLPLHVVSRAELARVLELPPETPMEEVLTALEETVAAADGTRQEEPAEEAPEAAQPAEEAGPAAEGPDWLQGV